MDSISETLNNIELEAAKELEALQQEFFKFEEAQIKARDEKALELQKKDAEIRQSADKKSQEALANFDKILEEKFKEESAAKKDEVNHNEKASINARSKSKS